MQTIAISSGMSSSSADMPTLSRTSETTAGHLRIRDAETSIEPVRDMIDRFKLQHLLRCLGLSLQEAALYTGLSSATLSRILRKRTDFVRVSVALQKLSLLAEIVDDMVESEARRIRRIRQMRVPKDVPQTHPRLLIYLRDEDLPPWFALPFASAHRAAMARIARSRGYRASLVAFERDAYLSWLGPGSDDSGETRMKWAIQAPLRRRLCIKIAGRYASSDVAARRFRN
jgi:transcriptional regulator with XRE-family HTH domain